MSNEKLKKVHYKFVFLFISISFFGFSQITGEIRAQKVDPDLILESPELFYEQMKLAIGKDLDTSDLLLFLKGPMIGALFVEALDQNEEVTYGYVVDRIQEIKNDIINEVGEENYYDRRQQTVDLAIFFDEVPTAASWAKDRKRVAQFGASEDELNFYDERIQDHVDSVKTYGEIFELLHEEYAERNEYDFVRASACQIASRQVSPRSPEQKQNQKTVA